jgi:molecular chaperone HtpG
MGQMEPGVALYCRKVLIDPKPKKFLPEWMRFVRGVVDSEDLPRNISRETMQDSALFRKLGQVVQGRVIKFLEREADGDAKLYAEFHKDFARFLKEGVATDYENREAVAKLLRFDSSMTGADDTIGLSAYVKRMKEDQKAIYYQIAPSREAIETGPYIEAFKSRGIEVLYLYETIDDYVVSSLGKFEDKPLQSVTAGDVDLGDATPEEGEALGKEETDKLCAWLKDRLTTRVSEVRSGKRLVSQPAMAVVPDGELSPQFRQMMRAMKKGGELGDTNVILEVNPSHPIEKRPAATTESNPDLAGLIAAQILDSSLMSAGLLEDPHDMIARMNSLMEKALG